MRVNPSPEDELSRLRAQKADLERRVEDLERQSHALENKLRRLQQHNATLAHFQWLSRGYRDQLIADQDTAWRIETHSRFSIYLPLGSDTVPPYLDSRHLYYDSDSARATADFSVRTTFAQAWYADLVAHRLACLSIDLANAKAIAALRLDPDLLRRLVAELGLQSMIAFPIYHRRELGAILTVESMSTMSETQFDQHTVRRRLANLPNEMHAKLSEVYLPAVQVADVGVVDWLF